MAEVAWFDPPTGEACAHLTVRHKPREHVGGSFSDRWLCGDCPTEFVPRQQRPKLTITHETSAEVRSATSAEQIIIIVHPKLGGSGGTQAGSPRRMVNRHERLSPKARVYILQGRAEQAGAVMDIEFVYAMSSEETFEEARDWLVKAWGFEVTDG